MTKVEAGGPFPTCKEPGRAVNRTPSRGQRKNIKIIKEWVAAKAATHSLCSQRQLVLFHRRKDTEITLHTSGVVISDVVLNHLGQFLFACKPFAVISFPLQDTPEALHGAIINTVGYARHTLRHPGLLEPVVENPAGILETSIAVE